MPTNSEPSWYEIDYTHEYDQLVQTESPIVHLFCIKDSYFVVDVPGL